MRAFLFISSLALWTVVGGAASPAFAQATVEYMGVQAQGAENAERIQRILQGGNLPAMEFGEAPPEEAPSREPSSGADSRDPGALEPEPRGIEGEEFLPPVQEYHP